MRKGSPRDYTAEIDCSQQPIQKSQLGEPHECYSLYRIRRRKKTIAYCVKTADGQIVEEGTLQAQRMELRRWAKRRQVVWQGAMEATLFSAWIYDTLKPYAQQLSMGHPAKMKAITAIRNLYQGKQ